MGKTVLRIALAAALALLPMALQTVSTPAVSTAGCPTDVMDPETGECPYGTPEDCLTGPGLYWDEVHMECRTAGQRWCENNGGYFDRDYGCRWPEPASPGLWDFPYY